ncbi:YciI family protein [Pseudooceanicola sp. MF1-13]|uniref:YciI family protein n=1 Tax=Pseudooceanicola sp. MF1-13 TaxID=3379095 RepID=UPI00389143EF
MTGTFAWRDMLDRAQAAKLLGKEMFVVLTSPAKTMDDIKAVLPEHLAFQRGLEAQGIMFAAGPLADRDDPETWGGEGMVLIRAASLDAAKQIADSDPMHSSGARTYVLRRWLINEGGFTLRVGFSSGGFELC